LKILERKIVLWHFGLLSTIKLQQIMSAAAADICSSATAEIERLRGLTVSKQNEIKEPKFVKVLHLHHIKCLGFVNFSQWLATWHE
jgi:hypothetical protein